jgi:hypothetical protein
MITGRHITDRHRDFHRSPAMLLIHEMLDLVRLPETNHERQWGVRPARLVAMAARRRRTRG